MKAISNRAPAVSKTVKTEVVCPNDTNPMGFLQGGRLVEWMDIAAAVCAQTHSEKICVTASINNVSFKQRAKVGDIVYVYAKITRAFTTSMEIFVQAYARKVEKGKKYLISDAYFTFVAIDENGIASPVVKVSPKSLSEREHFKSALVRRSPGKKKGAKSPV